MMEHRSKENIEIVCESKEDAFALIEPLTNAGYAVLITRDAAGALWVVEATYSRFSASSKDPGYASALGVIFKSIED